MLIFSGLRPTYKVLPLAILEVFLKENFLSSQWMVKTKEEVSVYLGADHRGFKLKEQIKEFLRKEDISFIDCGDLKYKKDDDYPDYAQAVAQKMQKSDFNARGILLCGSAEGVCITANKFKGIRAALIESQEQANLAVRHDHANVLCLPADRISLRKMKFIVAAFLAARPSIATGDAQPH